MEKLFKELDAGDIHFRDKWQFELKSEFMPLPALKANTYTQEFYLFIPNALQVNQQTYSKEQFYKSQTNLIRFKTPEFIFSELVDPKNDRSPLFRIREVTFHSYNPSAGELVEDELKLLGNIVRSALRERLRHLIEQVDAPHKPGWDAEIFQLCQDLKSLRTCFYGVQRQVEERWKNTSIAQHFHYVDEFISNAIHYYLTVLLEKLQGSSSCCKKDLEKALCDELIEELEHRELKQIEPKEIDETSPESEYILYRKGLLNKFVLDALLLTVNRFSFRQKYKNVIGGISAGIAMLFFMILFVWQGQVVLINSAPFVFITVVLYILKDRIKEGLKTVSYHQAFKWLSDFTTEIRSPDDKEAIGVMKESFSFIDVSQLPKEIQEIRNREFHSVLETFQRPERVIYYKKSVTINPAALKKHRRYGLNIIFRFDIHNFLAKADNPYHSYLTLDPESRTFKRKHLPKVYHINIIMSDSFLKEDLTPQVEAKKFRLIVDKSGIKRVEHVHRKI